MEAEAAQATPPNPLPLCLWHVVPTLPPRRLRPRLPMVTGRPHKLPSMRQDVTSCFANYSRRIAVHSRWHVVCAGGRKMLAAHTRKDLGLLLRHRKVDSSGSSAAQDLLAHPMHDSDVAATGP